MRTHDPTARETVYDRASTVRQNLHLEGCIRKTSKRRRSGASLQQRGLSDARNAGFAVTGGGNRGAGRRIRESQRKNQALLCQLAAGGDLQCERPELVGKGGRNHTNAPG